MVTYKFQRNDTSYCFIPLNTLNSMPCGSVGSIHEDSEKILLPYYSDMAFINIEKENSDIHFWAHLQKTK